MNEELLLPLIETRIVVAVAVGVMGAVFLTASPSRSKPAVKWLAGSAVTYGFLQLLVLAVMRLENLPATFLVFGTSVASIPVLMSITLGLEAYARPEKPLPWVPVVGGVLLLWAGALTLYKLADGWMYAGSLATSVWAGLTAARAFYWAIKQHIGLLAWFGLWLATIAVGLWPVMLLELPVELYRSFNVYPAMFAYATIAAMVLRQDTLALKDELKKKEEAQAALRALTLSLEQQVVQQSQNMDEVMSGLRKFASQVSHDLRAPVRNAAGLAEAALHELDESKDLAMVREYLQMILKESLRGGAVVNDILSLAKVQKGSLQLQPVSLTEVAREALAELEREYGVRVRKVRLGLLPELEVDPALLRIVFANVIGNSLKFGNHLENLQVEVSAEFQPESDIWVFEVRDNGPGFENRMAEELFRPFVKLGAASANGTGLGLPMVKRIIENHQGMVGASSELGRGATFWWTLPGPQNKAAAGQNKA